MDAEGFIDDGSAASLEGVTLVCDEGRGIDSNVGWADTVGFNVGWEDGAADLDGVKLGSDEVEGTKVGSDDG